MKETTRQLCVAALAIYMRDLIQQKRVASAQFQATHPAVQLLQHRIGECADAQQDLASEAPPGVNEHTGHLECKRCEHSWIGPVKHPVICPQCGSGDIVASADAA